MTYIFFSDVYCNCDFYKLISKYNNMIIFLIKSKTSFSSFWKIYGFNNQRYSSMVTRPNQ